MKANCVTAERFGTKLNKRHVIMFLSGSLNNE